MKTNKFLALALATTMIISCSKEEGNSVEEANLTQTVETVTDKGQTPNAQFDNNKKGLYIGLVAAKEGMSRGHLNLNVGNNGAYIASLDMANGTEFKLVANGNNLNDVYHFTGTEGSFNVNLADFNDVVVSDVVLNDAEYFAVVYKHTTTRMPAAATGTWLETGNPAFNGTWNIIADGTIVDPNGFGGEGVTSVFITRGGNMFMDTTMETFSFAPCGGPEVWIPTIGFVGQSETTTTTWGQTTTIGSAAATWDLIYDFNVPYSDPACGVLTSGTWSWNGKVGEIYGD
jgi:hypothetical protein